VTLEQEDALPQDIREEMRSVLNEKRH